MTCLKTGFNQISHHFLMLAWTIFGQKRALNCQTIWCDVHMPSNKSSAHGDAHTLDTDLCLNAIQRFMCKRGQVSIICSDNGTDDESLQTLMCEVEAIINDRPIAKSSDDVNNVEALSPNHILLLKRQPLLPPGLFEKEDLYSSRRWKHVQYLANLFWRQWVREYLPLLQECQKWTQVSHISFLEMW